jgi:hypothetical protein
MGRSCRRSSAPRAWALVRRSHWRPRRVVAVIGVTVVSVAIAVPVGVARGVIVAGVVVSVQRVAAGIVPLGRAGQRQRARGDLGPEERAPRRDLHERHAHRLQMRRLPAARSL